MPQYFIDDEEANPFPRPDPLPTPTPPSTGGPDATTGQPTGTPPPPPEEPRERPRNRPRDEGYPGMGGPVFRNIPAPTFVAPEFSRPTMADAYNEPGYQFRVDQGNRALERSAAARGVLRTGGTLRDIVEYNQNFAAQEYGQVFNRALSAYDRRYQGARDAFAPQLAQWQNLTANERARALAAYQREWDAYTFARRNQGGGGGGGYQGEPPPNPDSWIPDNEGSGTPSAPGIPEKYDERPGIMSDMEWYRYY